MQPANNLRSRKIIIFQTMLVLTRFAVTTDLSATQAASTASPTVSATAIEEFMSKYEVLRQQRRQGRLSAEDWDAKYLDLIESETEELKGMLPGILGEIGELLRHTAEDQERFDALSDLEHPTDEQSKELLSLDRKLAKTKEIPRCALTSLTAYLGRIAPKEAVDVLLTSDPPPEEADDWCYIKALMTIGPTGYQPILAKISNQRDLPPVYYGVMALVASSVDTGFPIEAGLGKENDWDRTIPKSRRGLQRLGKKWAKWWGMNENKFTWNPDTGLLIAK